MSEEATKVLYSGNLGIDYGQFYIDVAFDEDDDLDEDDDGLVPDVAFEGHKNGICGSALCGKLFFVTGLQNGIISISVELHQTAPLADDSYSEIVEVSYKRGEMPVSLCEWGHEDTQTLDLPPGNYRVRYCIDGMDKEYEDDSDWEAPLPGQRHLIQFWPSDPSEDEIVKLTSETAAYWHKEWGSVA